MPEWKVITRTRTPQNVLLPAGYKKRSKKVSVQSAKCEQSKQEKSYLLKYRFLEIVKVDKKIYLTDTSADKIIEYLSKIGRTQNKKIVMKKVKPLFDDLNIKGSIERKEYIEGFDKYKKTVYTYKWIITLHKVHLIYTQKRRSQVTLEIKCKNLGRLTNVTTESVIEATRIRNSIQEHPKLTPAGLALIKEDDYYLE